MAMTGRKNRAEIPRRNRGISTPRPPRQRYWERNLSGEAQDLVRGGCKRYFLHQSLSTPVLNVIARAQGIYIEDLSGKRYIDMHGNGVHNAGFNHPRGRAVREEQLDESLTFCPRRYTNIPAVRLAKKLAEITPGDLCRSSSARAGRTRSRWP